ncbi:MAG: hypothetical protein DI539_19790, partial [Flavobacterium psychrophilum]
EAEFYLTKAFQIANQYQETELETLKFVRIKVDFLLGKRSREQYITDLRSITAVTKNKFNSLQLRINIAYYTIIQKIESRKLDDALESDIMGVFVSINMADIDEERKMFLKVFHAENLQMYISSKMLHWVSQLRVKDSLGVQVSQTERMKLFTRTNELIELAVKEVLNARSFSQKQNNKALQAHAEYALARFFYIKEYDFLLLYYRDDRAAKGQDFRRMVLFAIHAQTLFLEIGLLKDARLSLICAYDLKRLARLQYGIEIVVESVTDEALINNITILNQEMGINTPFESIVDKTYKELAHQIEVEAKSSPFVNMNNLELEAYAKTLLEAYQLPDDRLIHVLNEIKSVRYFETNANTDDYELLTNLFHHQSKRTQYASPSTYIIRSKKTAIESMPSHDIETLCLHFGALKAPQ